jgi:5'-3' exonuclease
MEQIGSSEGGVDENLVRHMILNTIRKNVKKFKKEFGDEIVIACDSRHYWRKEIFPNYKAGRKKARNQSGHDWASIFECISKIKEEIKQNTHYKVIEIETCEADDIISILAQKYSPVQKVLILSGDKDFAQLQKFENVQQYSPIMDKYIKEQFPSQQLKQMIIRGDSGDGVPNILSPDDVFVSGGRQKPIMEKKLINWINQDPTEFCDENMLRNYKRNEMLIDLTKIPTNLQKKILEEFDNIEVGNKSKFLDYMIEKNLNNLIEVLDEF